MMVSNALAFLFDTGVKASVKGLNFHQERAKQHNSKYIQQKQGGRGRGREASTKVTEERKKINNDF